MANAVETNQAAAKKSFIFQDTFQLHLHPISTTLITWCSNVVPVCGSCNWNCFPILQLLRWLLRTTLCTLLHFQSIMEWLAKKHQIFLKPNRSICISPSHCCQNFDGRQKLKDSFLHYTGEALKRARETNEIRACISQSTQDKQIALDWTYDISKQYTWLTTSKKVIAGLEYICFMASLSKSKQHLGSLRLILTSPMLLVYHCYGLGHYKE